MIVYTLIVTSVILIFFDFLRRKRQCVQGMPKGPFGLPLFGHILQLGLSPHFTLSKWAKKFGKFYTINLFGNPALVINDPKTMRDLLGNLNSTGKYDIILLDIVHGVEHGIVNTEGNVWFEQHKFFMKVLRQFGFHGGSQLSSTILRECDKLCDWIDKELQDKKSGTLHFGKAFLNSVTNIIWNNITGEQQRAEDDQMLKILEKVVKHFNEASVLTFLPWLRYVAPGLSGYSNLMKTNDELQKEIIDTFENHKKARNTASHKHVAKTLIDAYLEQIENCQDKNSSFYGENGMKHGFFAVASLLTAGTETTSSTMNWLIHYLLAHPDKQRKVQNEVDAVTEMDKGICLIDKTRLSYLEAFVLEVLRISSLIPLGIMHKFLDNVSYDGFIFPKGTILLANLYHANHDIKVWKDPETFRPERFLEGTEAERKALRDCVVTFQEGRRKCPGEQLAKDLLFMFAFKLLKKYSFHKEENRNAQNYLKPVTGFLLLPPKLGIVVKRRNNM